MSFFRSFPSCLSRKSLVKLNVDVVNVPTRTHFLSKTSVLENSYFTPSTRISLFIHKQKYHCETNIGYTICSKCKIRNSQPTFVFKNHSNIGTLTSYTLFYLYCRGFRHSFSCLTIYVLNYTYSNIAYNISVCSI